MPRFDIGKPRKPAMVDKTSIEGWYYLPCAGDENVSVHISVPRSGRHYVEISGRKLYRELKRIYEPETRKREGR